VKREKGRPKTLGGGRRGPYPISQPSREKPGNKGHLTARKAGRKELAKVRRIGIRRYEKKKEIKPDGGGKKDKRNEGRASERRKT